MKECVLVGSPWWLSGLVAFMGMFMGAKMGERIIIEHRHHRSTRLKRGRFVGASEEATKVVPEGCLRGVRAGLRTQVWARCPWYRRGGRGGEREPVVRFLE